MRRKRWTEGGADNRILQYMGGKSLGTRSRGRTQTRCEDNIKMELIEVGCEAGRRAELTQNRV